MLKKAASAWGLPAFMSMYASILREGAYLWQVWGVLEKEIEFANTAVRFTPYLQGGEPGVVANLFLQFYEQALKGEMSFDDLLQKLQDETNIAIQDGMDQIGGKSRRTRNWERSEAMKTSLFFEVFCTLSQCEIQ